MVHASLSALGVVQGGAAAVVAALREAAGADGAVIMPSFRDAIRSEHYALTHCEHCGPRDLCPSREPGFTGIIGEVLREQPDALRSCHPTHSWVGAGRDAAFLLEGHRHSPTPCGMDSPFFRLMQRDGVILLLGVGIDSLTNIHAVEDARNVPYLSAHDPARRHATYTAGGRRIQYVYPELLHAALRETGILRLARIGASVSAAIRARDLGTFLWQITEADPWCLVLRPHNDAYDPFTDACVKIGTMVGAWSARPDDDGWKHLLDESRTPRVPVLFNPSTGVATRCPAYRGVVRGYHRCAANDLPPWEKFEDYPRDEPGVATCDQCNWPDAKTTVTAPAMVEVDLSLPSRWLALTHERPERSPCTASAIRAAR